MTAWREVFNALLTVFRWWFMVLPWEQAVRVRAGRHTRVFEAGWYLMIPFVDRVYVQNTRERLTTIPASTLSTKDGKTVTVAGSVGYRIKDSLLLQQTLHQAEETIRLLMAGHISDYIVHRHLAECTPAALKDAVNAAVDLSVFGLAAVKFRLTDFAVVKTFRLIEGQAGHWTTQGWTALDTNKTFDQVRPE